MRGRRYRPKPVREGEEYTVQITEISRRGDGVTRIKGLVIFVPNTRPGDRVRIVIRRVGAKYAIGEVVE